MRKFTFRPRMHAVLFVIVTLLVVGFISVRFTQAQALQENAPQAAAEKLLASLTPEQHQAVTKVFDAYESKLEAIVKDIAAVQPGASGQHRLFLPLIRAAETGKLVVSGQRPSNMTTENPTNPDTATVAALDAANTSVQEVQTSIQSELASILTPEQMALYQTALTTAPAPQKDSTTAAQAGDTGVAQVIDPVLCFNAAQWADYGLAYSKVAKSYALINAFDLLLGTNTGVALQSYISYNEAESYALDGLQNLSTASVLFTASDTLVINLNGGTLFGVKGDNDIAIAETRNDLARNLALTDYLASGGVIVDGIPFGGSTFAYLAYAYGNVADIYLDGTRVRTANCF